jgi:multiple sugar transport system substrate-binding protein
MTFDQVYDIAKMMTRSEAGTNYRGFSVNLNSVLRENPYSLPVLDPAADKLADPDKWQQMFTNLKRFYEIPGNSFDKTLADEANAFASGNVALAVNQFSTFVKLPDTFEWDMVSIPTLEGAPERVIQRGPAYWTIASTSKYKDEAFQVMMEMLSDEIQMNDSKQGMPTTLVNQEIIDALGTEHPVFKTKNLKAVSFYPPLEAAPRRDKGVFDLDAIYQTVPLTNNFIEFVTGKMDLNTALRTTEEQVLKKLEEEQAKVKK